ncbi:MAG: hypothetical protein KatS3mg091_526 [Patescibacteria group bacterium]|nr:MAG: hypothetical protein KatS3mg091_526 [Patescibacteria group bacterium]
MEIPHYLYTQYIQPEQYEQLFPNLILVSTILWALAKSRSRETFFKQRVKNEVLKQQNNRCPLCEMEIECSRSEAHHIIPVSLNGETTRPNCIVLCPECHKIADELAEKHKIALNKSNNNGHINMVEIYRLLRMLAELIISQTHLPYNEGTLDQLVISLIKESGDGAFLIGGYDENPKFLDLINLGFKAIGTKDDGKITSIQQALEILKALATIATRNNGKDDKKGIKPNSKKLGGIQTAKYQLVNGKYIRRQHRN